MKLTINYLLLLPKKGLTNTPTENRGRFFLLQIQDLQIEHKPGKICGCRLTLQSISAKQNS